jgi:hypothetical protein
MQTATDLVIEFAKAGARKCLCAALQVLLDQLHDLLPALTDQC